MTFWSLLNGLIKKNYLFLLLYMIIFIICFFFTDVCIYLGMQFHSFEGILLVLGAVIYVMAVITVILKMQVIIDRSIWASLFRMGIYLKERFIITGLFDGALLSFSLLVSKLISYSVVPRLMEKTGGILFMLLSGTGIEILITFLAFLFQNHFITTMCEGSHDSNELAVNEKIPLFLKNVLRNKAKMRIVVGLISFGIITCNSILFLLNSDEEKIYIDHAISVDYFLTGHDTRSDEIRIKDEFVKKEDIMFVEQQSSFLEGGCLFHSLSQDRTTLQTSQLPERSQFDLFAQNEFEKDDKGQYFLNLYGCDDFVFEQMDICEGEIDYNKLRSGNFIIYGLVRRPGTMEYLGDISNKWQYFHVGDHITIKGSTGEKDYEIMAICAVNHTYSENHEYSYPGKELVFYLPSKEYLSYGNDEVMRYLFNTKNGDNIDESLQNISYESRQQWIERYRKDKEIIRNSSIFFAFGCVGIGLFVFMNVLILSYIDRKKEFEVLGNIGMTSKQVRGMIFSEGISYGIIIFFVCSIISLLIIMLGKLMLIGESWHYRFTMEPVWYCSVIILVLTTFIPMLVYQRICHQDDR